MDFPARGIIRGRWEICCVQANMGLAPATFRGAGDRATRPASSSARYRSRGPSLAGLPEEVRAFDADDVRRVQEAARELVRAGALARTRRTTLAARSVSDFVRVDRVEGLALGAGVSHVVRRRIRARASPRATAPRTSAAKVRGSPRVDLGTRHPRRRDAPRRPRTRRTRAGGEWARGTRSPRRSSGPTGPIRYRRSRGGSRSPWDADAEVAARASHGRARRRAHRPLAVNATPGSGRYEPALSRAMAARVDRGSA